MKTKYYAVRNGRKKGIYTSWTECQEQVSGFTGSKFKSFFDREDALLFVYGESSDVVSLTEKDPKVFQYNYHGNCSEFKAPVFTEGLWKSFYYIFTDGSYRNQKSLTYKSGYGVFTYDKHQDNIMKRNNETHNYCELRAILEALLLIVEQLKDVNKNNDLNRKYMIVSDSEYCVLSICRSLKYWKENNWKRKTGSISNLATFVSIYGLLSLLSQKQVLIGFMTISSHTKAPLDKDSLEFYLWYGNLCADKLAVGKVV